MQICADIYSAATADSLPTEETVNLLTEVLYELPELGDKLLRAIGLVHLRLDIHIACLHRYLDELSGNIDTGSHIEPSDAGQHVAAAQFYRSLSLFDVPVKADVEKKADLYRLLLRIVNLLTSGTSTLDRMMVLSCLLFQKSWSMCRWTLKLLDIADLHRLIGRTVPLHISSVYSHTIAPSLIMPISFFNKEQMLFTDIDRSMSESEVAADDTSLTQRMIDQTGIIMSDLPTSTGVNDDISCILSLSSTASHCTAWHRLYLICFERKIHFIDLFLVCNTSVSYMYLTYCR